MTRSLSYILDQFLSFHLRKYSTSYFDFHKRRTMNLMIVMAIVAIAASLWGNSNAIHVIGAGAKLSGKFQQEI